MGDSDIYKFYCPGGKATETSSAWYTTWQLWTFVFGLCVRVFLPVVMSRNLASSGDSHYLRESRLIRNVFISFQNVPSVSRTSVWWRLVSWWSFSSSKHHYRNLHQRPPMAFLLSAICTKLRVPCFALSTVRCERQIKTISSDLFVSNVSVDKKHWLQTRPLGRLRPHIISAWYKWWEFERSKFTK